MKYRSFLSMFFLASVFLIGLAVVAPSVEKMTMLLVGVPTLALSLLAARFAKIGKLAAALPVVLAVWFLSSQMGVSAGYNPNEMNFWAGVLVFVIAVSVILAKHKKVVENPVTAPSRALDMAGFQEEPKASFPWGRLKTHSPRTVPTPPPAPQRR